VVHKTDEVSVLEKFSHRARGVCVCVCVCVCKKSKLSVLGLSAFISWEVRESCVIRELNK
jgi:hypothetical protein